MQSGGVAPAAAPVAGVAAGAAVAPGAPVAVVCALRLDLPHPVMAIRTAAASSIVALFMAERFHAGARGNPLFAWKALHRKNASANRAFGPICLAASILAGCSHYAANVTTRSAGAGQAATGGAVIVPAGTDYYGKIDQPIGTKTSKDGDTFALNETRSTNQSLTGVVIDGHLENVQSAGPMRNPKITIVFDDIRLADGTKAPVDVQLITTRAFAPRTHRLRTIGLMAARSRRA